MAEFAFAFMDCEFGGLDPELHDITEIAVIVTDYRLAELASGEWKIAARPHRITPESAEISGYRAEDWQGAPHLREVLAAIDALLPAGKTVVPAGQNVRMDVSFLERAYRACERAYPFDYHVIDLATLFYTWSLVAGEPVAALSLRQAAINAGLDRRTGAAPRDGGRAPHAGHVPALRGPARAAAALRCAEPAAESPRRAGNRPG